MTLFLLPLILATLVRVIHFTYNSDRNWTESLPNTAILLNMLLVWICIGLQFILPFFYYENSAQSKKEEIIDVLLGDILNQEAVSIFIYTWTFLDVVIVER